MVEGNLKIITSKHWLIGLKTAFISSTVLLIISMTDVKVLMNSFLKNLAITAIVVAFVDHFIHPSHFGGEYGEAVVTGITAASLVFMIGLVRKEVSQTK